MLVHISSLQSQYTNTTVHFRGKNTPLFYPCKSNNAHCKNCKRETCKNKTPFSTAHCSEVTSNSQPGPLSALPLHIYKHRLFLLTKTEPGVHIALQTLFICCVWSNLFNCHFSRLQQHRLLQQAKGHREMGTWERRPSRLPPPGNAEQSGRSLSTGSHAGKEGFISLMSRIPTNEKENVSLDKWANRMVVARGGGWAERVRVVKRYKLTILSSGNVQHGDYS